LNRVGIELAFATMTVTSWDKICRNTNEETKAKKELIENSMIFLS
jgi:hypothetical protein